VIELVLPYPPSVNTYWRHNRGRTHISTKGKMYRSDVILAVMMQLKGHVTLTDRLKVTITALMPDKRRRDLDNLPKAVLDSLQHAGVYEDDSQIDDLHIIRGPILRGGLLNIEIVQA